MNVCVWSISGSILRGKFFTQTPLILNFISKNSTWIGLGLNYNAQAVRTVAIFPGDGVIFVL